MDLNTIARELHDAECHRPECRDADGPECERWKAGYYTEQAEVELANRQALADEAKEQGE